MTAADCSHPAAAGAMTHSPRGVADAIIATESDLLSADRALAPAGSFVAGLPLTGSRTSDRLRIPAALGLEP